MKTKPFTDDYSEQCSLINPEKPVRVYRNLSASHNGEKGIWSVKQDRVAFHTTNIYLKDVEFLVNEKHRQRVIKEKVKNVHAFVKGYICTPTTYFYRASDPWFLSGDIYYNPYKTAHFMTGLHHCDTATVCHMWKGTTEMRVHAKGIETFSFPLDNQLECGILESVETHLL